MRTQHCSSPSLRQLLLLSACAVAACSKASMASGDLNGQPNPESNMHGETAAKEERTLSSMKSAVQTLTDVVIEYAEPFLSGKEWFVDRLIRDKIVPGPKMYRTPKFIEVVDRVKKMHNSNNDAAMKSLFDRLVHANKAQFRDLAIRELMTDFAYFKFVHIPEEDETMLKLKSIIEELEKPLLQYWKSDKYDPKTLQSSLELDIKSSSFFENPNVWLWIDYLAERDGRKNGGPFDYALIQLRYDFDDVEIATKLLAAGANDKERLLAYGVKEALFRDRSKSVIAFTNFLRQLVPSLEKGILNGPIIFWIDHARSSLYELSYPILVNTLVQPKEIPSEGAAVLKFQMGNELALVDIIADEWSKGSESHLSKLQSTPPSPHANPISIALSKNWELRKMTVSDVWGFLKIDALEDSLMKSGRKRVWTVFTATTVPSEDMLDELLLKFSEMELTNLLAPFVDDAGLYHKLTQSLFQRWKQEKKTSADVFAALELESPGIGMFENRRLVIWLGYLDYQDETIWDQWKVIEDMYKGTDFWEELVRAISTSTGMRQLILGKLWRKFRLNSHSS